MEQKRCMRCMNLKSEGIFCEHCGFDERIRNNPHQLPMGTVLKEQYLVGKALGQGGFGITYIGFDLFLQTPVAIKEYYPQGFVMRDGGQTTYITQCENVSDGVFQKNRERFLREAQSLAKLSNVPEVVRVQNFFGENGTAYIIMEFLQGQTMKDYVKQYGALSADWVLKILLPVMQGLQKVHEAGIIHRDISPDNIMVLPDGKVKLLDFGAVRDYSVAVTHNTQAILKPGFAPPEQYQTNGNIGPWTDVYAFCATLYYCMTGTMCPEAPKRMMEGVHPDWTRIPGLTPAQVTALQQGMALPIGQRIQTMGDLINALFYVQSYQPPVQQWDSQVKQPVSQVQTPVSQVQTPVSRIQQSVSQQSVSQVHSGQGQVSEEALERARQWKAQKAAQAEEERRQQEQAQRIAEERARREAERLAQQAQSGNKTNGVVKKLLIIFGVAMALILLLVLNMGGDSDEEPQKPAAATVETQPQQTQPEPNEELPEGMFACTVTTNGNVQTFRGEGLLVTITDGRRIQATVDDLNVRDQYEVNDPEEDSRVHQYSWQLSIDTPEETIKLGTHWAIELGVIKKTITPEQMEHSLWLQDQKEKENGKTVFSWVAELDNTVCSSNGFFWEVTLPETFGGSAFPFDASKITGMTLSVYDQNEGSLKREYILHDVSADNRGLEAIAADIEPHATTGEKEENYVCQVNYTDSGMEVAGPGLLLRIDNERNVSVDLYGLNIQDSYTINYPGSKQYYEEAGWVLQMSSDTELVELSTRITHDNPGDQKTIQPENMRKLLSVRDQKSYPESVDYLDVFEYEKDHLHWEVQVPEKGQFSTTENIQIPFNFREYDTFWLKIIDNKNDLRVIRNYTLK